MTDCPHDIPGLRDRIAVAEARIQDQRERHDRLEMRLDEMQKAQDAHHAEVMQELRKLHQQQATDRGAREESARWWKRAGIVAGVIAALVALGLIDEAESSPVATVGVQKEIKPNRLEVEGIG